MTDRCTRRTFVTGLVAASAGLAGCTGRSDTPQNGSTPTGTRTPTEKRTPTATDTDGSGVAGGDPATPTATDTPPGTENDIPDTPTPTDSPTPTPGEYNQYGYDTDRVTVHYQKLRGDVYRYPTVFAAVTNETGQEQGMEIHTEARDDTDSIVARNIRYEVVGNGETWYNPAVLEGTTMDEIAYWRGAILSGD